LIRLLASPSRSWLPLALAVLCAPSVACAELPPQTPQPPGLKSPFIGYESARYRDPRMWLCRPDLPNSPCRADLTTTELLPDGSRAIVPHAAAAAPKVDCFYVYPTVDMSLFPGNDTKFTDLSAIEKATIAQAARFDEVCSLYVPLYRQISVGTYIASADSRERRLEVAFSDILDAFEHYMGQYNHGRKVVLLGHSQGADMVVRLLKKLFDHDATMRDRLLVAMPIGVGNIEVPHGQTVGATFDTIPICTSPDETGCVVAYRSYEDGTPPSPPKRDLPKPGNDTVCVNPAASGSDALPHYLSRSYLPAPEHMGMTTQSVLLRNFYAARCEDGAAGFRYLAVSAAPGAGDVRKSVVDFHRFWLRTALGLHPLDFAFAEGDLTDLVARKAARVP
jgi:hypothetical protein